MIRRAAIWLLFVAGSIVVWSVLSPPSQSPGMPESAPTSSAVDVAIAAIEAGTGTSPLIGAQPRRGLPTVTFLAKREGTDPPRVVSDVTGWGERADGSFDANAGKMTRVGMTDWYALETKVAPYARIEYLIAYGPSDFRLDPHNPRRVQRVGGPASEFVMPGYQPPQEFVDAPARPSGQVEEFDVRSAVIGEDRHVWVYTPAGYQDGGYYPVAVFHDGGLVVNTGQAPRVLDWLIAHDAIEPIVAVFVEPKSRVDDFKRGAEMRAFVTRELLPWLADHYSVTRDAGERAIIGISAGARAALDAAVTGGSSALDAYNRVGLLIPALTQEDVDAIPMREHRRLRASIVAAMYDTTNLPAARAAQLNLADHGHVVQWNEVPEGHSTNTWKNHLRTVLVQLFGPVR